MHLRLIGSAAAQAGGAAGWARDLTEVGQTVAFGRLGVDFDERVAVGMDPAADFVPLGTATEISRVWCQFTLTSAGDCVVANLSTVNPVEIVAPRSRQLLEPVDVRVELPRRTFAGSKFRVRLRALRDGRDPLIFELIGETEDSGDSASGWLPPELGRGGRHASDTPRWAAEALRRSRAQWETLRELTWEYRHWDLLDFERDPRPISNERIARRLDVPVKRVENRLSTLALKWEKSRFLQTGLPRDDRRDEICALCVRHRIVEIAARQNGWELGLDG